MQIIPWLRWSWSVAQATIIFEIEYNDGKRTYTTFTYGPLILKQE